MKTTYNGWMNVYRNGWFHREGKPGDCSRHGGDLYLSYDEAVAAIEPLSHFVATVPVTWDDVPGLVTNPADSVPIPLSVSRKNFAAQQLQESQQ